MTTISIRVNEKQMRKIKKVREAEQSKSPYPLSRHAFLLAAIMETVERKAQHSSQQ